MGSRLHGSCGVRLRRQSRHGRCEARATGDAAVQFELARRFDVQIRDCARATEVRLAELVADADVVVDASSEPVSIGPEGVGPRLCASSTGGVPVVAVDVHRACRALPPTCRMRPS